MLMEHMDLLDQGNTSGRLLLDSWKTINPVIHPTLLHVLTVLQHYPLFPPLWEMTTFVRVGILPQLMLSHSKQMDPLWDGQGCGSSSCCELSYPPGVTPPWFCKQLPQTTTDDIEVRLCGDEGTADEDTPVELIELYIN